MGKGEIARNEQFLLFPPCFLLNQIIVSPFVNIDDIISLFPAELEKPKIGISGKELKYFADQTMIMDQLTKIENERKEILRKKEKVLVSPSRTIFSNDLFYPM